MAEPGDPLKTEQEDDLFEDIADAVLDESAAPGAGISAVPMSTQDDPVHDDSGHADSGHDDLIGFASAASLAGVACPPGWGRPEEAPEVEPDLFDPPPRPVNRLAALRAETFGGPASTVAAIDAVGHPPERPSPARAAPPETAEGAMGLFAVYALLLGAVPTVGVSALVALVAVTVRPRPDQPLARSHFDFQKRTVWIAAVAAVLGVMLIAVNIGVPVLFLLAVWTLARGAWGLLTLAQGRTIRNPRQWLIAGR